MPEPLDAATLDLSSEPELGALLATCPDIAPLGFRDGEQLVTEGQASRDLYIVLTGSLVVEKALPDGTMRPLAQLASHPARPVIVGEMAYFGARTRTATVRAVGRCQALHLQPTHLDTIMAGFPGLTRTLCRQFTQRLKEANEELLELKLRFNLAAERRMVPAGEVLFQAGEPATTLFQVVLGALSLDEASGTRTVRPLDLQEGFLDLEAYLGQRPHTATAIALEPCFLAVIGAAHREAFVRNHPGLTLQTLLA